MIEINLQKLERGAREGRVKVVRGGKTFYRRQRVGKKEPEKGEEVTKIISNYEKNIKDQDFESCGIFGDDGSLIFTKDGEKDLIAFDRDEASKIKGGIFTHNHPKGNSFSPSDIRSGCVFGSKEVRVITPKNKSFSLKMKDGSNLYTELWGSKIQQSFEKHTTAVRGYYTVEIDHGRMTAEEAQGKHYHEVWTRVANDIDEIIYKGE